MILKEVSAAEGKELIAGLAARRRELDKAYKACSKADAQNAADKVVERMKNVDSISAKLKEALEE